MQYKTVFVDARKAMRGTVVQKIDGAFLAEAIEAAMNDLGQYNYQFERYIEVNSSNKTLIEGYILIFRSVKSMA